MKLHIETRGQGEPLVLLHGWGLHGAVWEEVISAFAPSHQVLAVDLPGFGLSGGAGCDSAECLAEAVAEAVPLEATWVGWSLGGLAALAAAQRGDVGRLVLVGSTPRFVEADNWPAAVPTETLAVFAEQLEDDFKGTLLRFLALQARGSERGKEELRRLRELIFARGEPTIEALRRGLRILRETDLRPGLGALTCPVLFIQGERDRLTPPEAARSAARVAGAEVAVIAGAGHAPFLSHPEAFCSLLENFLRD